MICVFDKNADDFTTNGIAPLAPLKCEVTETLNGEYRLEMKHPYDDFGKWENLKPGNIIKAPVPKMNTPQLTMITIKETTTSGGTTTITYKYASVYKCTAGQRIRMHTGPGIHNGPCVDHIEEAEEVIAPVQDFVYVENDDYYVRCTSPRGITGYVRLKGIAFVRDLYTTTTTGGGSITTKEEIREVVPSKKVREQPFRIYRVVHNLKEVTVYAKHLFYDLQDNMILKYEPDATLEGKKVAEGILSATLSPHMFTLYSDVTDTATDVLFEKMNPADAILNENDGFCAKYHAEILRDWYDVYLVSKVGEETNMTIADGKNLKTLTYDADITDTANRIIPVGRNSNGDPLYLPETYIQSPDMLENDAPRYIVLDVPEADMGEVSQAVAYEKMREAANEEFNLGADQPVETVTVDYIDMTGVDEYKSIGLMDNIFLGDLVHVRARRLKKDFIKRMTQYKYDCLTQRYTKITLGTPYDIN